MQKVKCKNGHFFNLDKFSCCPLCGSGVNGRSVRPVSQEKLRVSLTEDDLDDDKTTLLEDPIPAAEPQKPEEKMPVSGIAGGIKWNFSHTPSQEQEAPVQEPEKPQADRLNVDEVLDFEDTPSFDGEDFHTEPLPEEILNQEEPKEEPPKGLSSALSQAVAATGGSIYSALPKTVSYYEQPEQSDTENQTIEPVVGWLVGTKGVYRGRSFSFRTGRNKIGRNPGCDIQLTEDIKVSREPHAILIYEPRSRKFYLQTGESNGLVYLNGEPVFTHALLNSHDRIEIGNGEYLFVPLCGEDFAWEDC